MTGIEVIQELEEIQDILGVLHTRLNILANTVHETVTEIPDHTAQLIGEANRDMGAVWELLELIINPED